jgi:hypothetical protein
MVTAKKREEEAYRDAEAGLGMQRETDMVMRQGLGRGRGCENLRAILGQEEGTRRMPR